MVLVAALQYRPPKGRPAEARSALADYAHEAGRAGCDLLVCPEMATTGYVWPDADSLRPHAEPAEGSTFATLAPIAREHRMWIVCGYPERDGEALYNSALVIAPDGSLVTSYRKIDLYVADRNWARAGSERPLIRTAFGLLTPGICMDLNDWDFTAFLRRHQPDVVAFCTNWVDQGERVEWYWAEQLAGYRGLFVAADSWGADEHVDFYGRSAVMRGGRVLAQLGPAEDGLLYWRAAEVTSTATSSSDDTSGAR